MFLPIVFDTPPQESSLPMLDSSRFEELDQLVITAQSDHERQPLGSDQEVSVVRVPRWKRHNRKPPNGNNKFGKGGTLRCGHCRHRKIKCVYATVDSVCEFCVSRGFTDCNKLKPPKAKSRLVPHRPVTIFHTTGPQNLVSAVDDPNNRSAPSRPITIYDPAIEPAEIHGLQFLFSAADASIFHGSNVTALLAKTIFRCYGPSIIHAGLRQAVLAHVYREANPTLSFDYLCQATATLRRKMVKSEPDEGDLFLACLLALWHSDEDWQGNDGFTPESDEQIVMATKHVSGVLAIMKHLSEKADVLSSSPLRVFWQMIRDALVTVYWSDHIHEAFKEIIGGNITDQRQRYQHAIVEMGDDSDLKRLRDLSVRSIWVLLELHGTRFRFYILRDTVLFLSDFHLESILRDSCVEISPDTQDLLQKDLDISVQNFSSLGEQGDLDTAFNNLVNYYVMQLSTIVVAATSIEIGLCSTDALGVVLLIRLVCDQIETIVKAAHPDVCILCESFLDADPVLDKPSDKHWVAYHAEVLLSDMSVGLLQESGDILRTSLAMGLIEEMRRSMIKISFIFGCLDSERIRMIVERGVQDAGI